MKKRLKRINIFIIAFVILIIISSVIYILRINQIRNYEVIDFDELLLSQEEDEDPPEGEEELPPCDCFDEEKYECTKWCPRTNQLMQKKVCQTYKVTKKICTGGNECEPQGLGVGPQTVVSGAVNKLKPQTTSEEEVDNSKNCPPIIA